MSLKAKILRSFGQFDQQAARARKHFTAALMSKAYSGLPFLFEMVSGRAAPGAGSQLIHSQDHGRYGGRPLPRNLVFGGDIGWGDDSAASRVALFYVAATTGPLIGDWFSFGEGLSAPLDSLEWLFEGYVSPGIDTPSGNATDGSTMGLETDLIVVVNQPAGTGDVHFRVKNVTSGAEQLLSGSQESSVVTVSPGASSTDLYYNIEFDDVPCIGDEWNRFDIQFKADAASHVWLEFVNGYETRERSEPAGNGSSNLRTLTF